MAEPASKKGTEILRARSECQESADEGSQTLDDSRSWCSQKSDAGYHSSSGYYSSGAMSDGGGIANREQHSMSSLRSSGSVGSHEESSSDRFAGNRHHFRGYATASHLVSGETRFPTAMSYASDAQRSDVATVCSNSVAEDIEVESVFSQEGDHQITAPLSNTHLYQSPPSSEKNFTTGGNNSRRGGGNNRVVDFASAPLQQQPLDPRKTATVVPLKGPLRQHDYSSTASGENSLSINAMGPPLSRALLMQKAEGIAGAAARAGSVKSDDCGGSLDVETHSIQSQEDTQNIQRSETAINEKLHAAKPKDSSSRADSVKSFGSTTGSDRGDMDDCANSLDVEVYSNETRSVLSQDDAELAEPDCQAEDDTNQKQQQDTITVSLASSSSDPVDKNGRRSPGGTIYKGRGVRRYQGRYMHLPLQRFHQNGVHLDSVEEYEVMHNRIIRNAETANGYSGDHWCNKDDNERSRNGGPRRNGLQRDRSRSRSRSPAPEDMDGDRFNQKCSSKSRGRRDGDSTSGQGPCYRSRGTDNCKPGRGRNRRHDG